MRAGGQVLVCDLNLKAAQYLTAEQLEAAIPLGRIGRAEEIGGTVVYLASRAGASPRRRCRPSTAA